MKFLNYFLVLVLIVLLTQSCARKGTPSGGPKDEEAPILVTAKPAYESTNFKGNNIRIYFNEYIVLRDLNKKLIVSPPFKNPALITPQGTPSKYINIKILDTLKENTTYTFNFGDAVQDNNEGNKIENFKYVFSTGKYIDSLSLKGSVLDLIEPKKTKNYSVLLYKSDSSYTDSIIFKKKPDYVTKTYDSINFEFTNISEGKYRLFALDEETTNYVFNSKSDKIGFLVSEISLPKDSIISKPIVLFSEDQPFSFKRGKEDKKGKIKFGFTGKASDLSVKLLTKVSDSFASYSRINTTKDSLLYWHTPVALDSLNFIVTNGKSIDSTRVTLRKKTIDSLVITNNITMRNIHLKDTLQLFTNTPIVAIDSTKFSLTVSDSIPQSFKLKQLDFDKVGVMFDLKTKSKYRLKVLPKAITDLYGTQSKDTLNLLFITKQVEDYGEILLDVKKEVEAPVIIQLIHNNKIIKQRYLTSSEKIEFKLLDPKKYSIKAIIDENKNGVWDSGNYLQKQQPEPIIYYQKELELRANWVLNEVMNIKKER